MNRDAVTSAAAHAPTWTSNDGRVAARLDRSDFKRVADARRALWTAGFQGLVGGAALGLLTFATVARLQNPPAWLTSKHNLLFILVGGAMGSFTSTVVAGGREFPRLDDGEWAVGRSGNSDHLDGMLSHFGAADGPPHERPSCLHSRAVFGRISGRSREQ